MTKYFTRVRRRRVYSWHGRPVIKDRKQLHLQYGGLVLKLNENEVTILPGDFVLIEGDDEERPFVAMLKELYDDGTEKHASKHATVQWFLRYEEVPFKKRKLLGREPHPQEIFLYESNMCDNDIDAETIIGTVSISQLKPDEPFPESKKSEHILFLKLLWDGKSFKPLTSSINGAKERIAVSNRSLPNKSLPMPNFYPMEGDTAESKQTTRSTTKSQKKENEIESRHSASKCSHSKEKGAQRLPNGMGTPGARKKLELNSPHKSLKPIQKDAFLEDEFKPLEPAAPKRKVAFTGLLDSPPKKPFEEQDFSSCFIPLKPLKDLPKLSLRLTPLRRTVSEEQKSEKTPIDLNSGRKRIDKAEKSAASKSKTPQKMNPTPKKSTSSSRRPSQEQNGEEPQTPRSRRKSATASVNRMRKQIKLLSESDLSEMDESEDDFVPLKDSAMISSSEDENNDGEQESEEEKPSKRNTRKGVAPQTPSSSRKTSARTPNKTPRSKNHTATPKIPERNQPIQKPANVLEEARIRLHVSAVPESLPCREQEYQDVYSFVESKLLDGTGGCMYISGVPGTGKTATVHEVIRNLQQAADEDELPSFQYIEINGMKLTDPHQAYVQILKLLTGQKATADHAAALLEKRFSTPASKRETTVLLVDELDLLWTRKQNVLYSLFDWPTRKQAKLIVLAIANTMDLPERIMMNRVASRLGLTRMSFQPYTHKQLQQIITSRLNHVKAFDDDAIQLVARKVAALSGDARRCLDICRRSTEICEFTSKKGEPPVVKMPHVIQALDEMFSSPYVIAVRNASVLEQCFLRAVISEFRRSGLEEATFQQVYHHHIALCRIEGLQPPTMSETMAVCLRLGASRLLLVESSRNDLHLRVRLNISQDDIMYALKEE
ncbi:PREDICTED: origin recognition complex subunit 1 [Nanorana parkeri]|uniref:origin recognition complex subunit 1 n=1 Tax=Nanorana parkeri TaxID=125878 RepID=UPI0008543011|nr:PREDICTED: origin recognition complex subunit 1 [Nanorana parkeri]